MVEGKVVGVALAAIAAIGFAAYSAWSLYDGSRDNGHLPRDFPHAYLPGDVHGDRSAMVVWRGRMPPPPPVVISGVECWPAYRCINPECPALAEHGSQWVFPFGHVKHSSPGKTPVTWCAPCAQAKKDHQQLTFATTDEGEALLQEIRKDFAP